MKRTVLDVGNCNPDHAAIASMLRRNFDVEVLRANQLSDALECLSNRHVDLILVNRKLDIDYSDGLDIVRHLKQDERLQDIPVMLITNYPDHQQLAVDLGAEYGFGKLELQAPATHAKLERFLSSHVASGGP